jgi:4-amino-4-deoxy-L-arabinose transferase-like glycosyltransferase
MIAETVRPIQGSKFGSGMNSHEKSWGSPGGVLAGLLLVFMAVLAGGAALRESVTIDEVAHIGAGVSYLQKLDLRMNPEHPPLPKVLAALPLVCRGVHADYNHISWTTSEKFLPAFLGQWVFGDWLLERWNDPKSVLAWARLPMLLVTLALGCAVYFYAWCLGGTWGGLLCLGVYVSTPAFLAFGPLVHTDLAVTLFSLLSLWTFAEMWQEPNRKNVVLFGLSLAGALLSKFTAGVLFAAFVAFALSLRWRPVPGQPGSKPELRPWRRARRRAALKGASCAALVVYTFYFVFSWHQSTGVLERFGTGPAALLLRRLLMPPLLYLGGVLWVVLSGRRGTFVLGHAYPQAVWFYFPVVFALKSSLGFLGLLLLAAVTGIGKKVRREANVAVIPAKFALHWRVLWVSLLVFTGVCLLSPLDISIRHFSVPIALLIMLLAPLPRMLGDLRGRFVARAGAGAVVVLAVSCLFTAVRSYPYYLPYINALSLGRPTYALVNDSNVDWNQGLPEVRRFAEQQGLRKIALDQYGFSDVTPFVPQAYPWNCQTPTQEDAGQWVTLSAANLLEARNCAWLLRYPHVALAGGSIYAVSLPAQIPAVGSAGGPPLPSAYRTFGGLPFETRGFFSHVIQNPGDLPRAVEWMQSAFNASSKSQGSPPQVPWER